MWREKLLWQQNKFKMQRHQWCNSWKIWLQHKVLGRQQESPKQRLKRGWILAETDRAIMQVPTMRWMVKTMKMMKIIHSTASWLIIMNLAGWWAQSAKQYSTKWRVFGRSRWGLTNWRNRDGGTQTTSSMRQIWSMGLPNWRFLQLSSLK